MNEVFDVPMYNDVVNMCTLPFTTAKSSSGYDFSDDNVAILWQIGEYAYRIEQLPLKFSLNYVHT